MIEAGETISVGVDVGGQRSATAVAWLTDDLRVGVWIGHGDDAVPRCRRRAPRARRPLQRARGGVRPVAGRAAGGGAGARRDAVRRLSAVRQPHDPGVRAPARRGDGTSVAAAGRGGASTSTPRTRSPGTGAAAGVWTSRTTARRTTRSSRCAWRWSRSRTGPSRRAARVRVKRRCIGCRGSRRRLLLPELPAAPARPRTCPRPPQPRERRARLTAAQGGRCARLLGELARWSCTTATTTRQTTTPANHVMMCRRCHRIAGLAAGIDVSASPPPGVD